MPAESNDNEPGAVNSESTREEVLDNCNVQLEFLEYATCNISEPMCLLCILT